MADFNVKPLEATLDFDHLRYWDVVIIGAGPAGLAASLTAAHRALTTLVIEAKGTPDEPPQFLLRQNASSTSRDFPTASPARSCRTGHIGRPATPWCSSASAKI
jgi:hypothetical protein